MTNTFAGIPHSIWSELQSLRSEMNNLRVVLRFDNPFHLRSPYAKRIPSECFAVSSRCKSILEQLNKLNLGNAQIVSSVIRTLDFAIQCFTTLSRMKIGNGRFDDMTVQQRNFMDEHYETLRLLWRILDENCTPDDYVPRHCIGRGPPLQFNGKLIYPEPLDPEAVFRSWYGC